MLPFFFWLFAVVAVACRCSARTTRNARSGSLPWPCTAVAGAAAAGAAPAAAPRAAVTSARGTSGRTAAEGEVRVFPFRFRICNIERVLSKVVVPKVQYRMYIIGGTSSYRDDTRLVGDTSFGELGDDAAPTTMFVFGDVDADN